MVENKEKFVEQAEHQSKIVSVRIENFMSIKDAIIEFDDSNIISLCGYNDSGKSAISRIVEIMFYNAYPNDQVRFITDGEDYWKGVMTFSDGVEYTRIKYLDGKSFWELKKGDKVLYTNKLPNGTFAALSTNPEIIENYLGVLYEELTGEEINVRRNTDSLFLIETKGSDNYKILNSVLKSDVLTNAGKALNDDKNRLSKDIDELSTTQRVLTQEYEEIEVAPTDYLDELERLIGFLDESKGKLTHLTLVIEENKKMYSVSLYDEVKPIDTSRLVELQQIIKNLSESKGCLYEPLSTIETERLSALQNIIKLSESMQGKTYDPLEEIDVERMKVLHNICDLFNTYSGASSKFEEVDKKLKETRDKLLKLSSEHNLKVCKNCGSIVD